MLIDLLNKNGIISFIAPNTWVTSSGASTMRNKILSETQILRYVDFTDHMIFNSAAIQTMVFCLKKSQEGYSDIRYTKVQNSNFNESFVTGILCGYDREFSLNYRTHLIHREYIGRTLSFISENRIDLFNKLRGNSIYLQKDEIAQGIVIPQSNLNKKNKEILGDDYTVGEGIFVLSRSELTALKFSEEELQFIRPFYDTSQIKQYIADLETDHFLIYTTKEINDKINLYPNIKRHLDRFVPIITSDNKPYGLHRPRDERFFKGEKIIATRKCEMPTFTYSNGDCYLLQTFNIIKTNRVNLLYLVGLLNSKLIKYWLKNKGKMQGNIYQLDREPLMEIPIKTGNEELNRQVVNYVKSIIDNHEVDNSNIQNIDKAIYEIYGLTPEEIALVENTVK